MTDKSVGNVPLVEVINALREDLKTAEEQSDPKNPLIIEEIEVELQVVVTKGVELGAKAKFEVLNIFKLGEANLKGDWAKASTQKIKLKLSAGSVDPETGKITKRKVSTTTSVK